MQRLARDVAFDPATCGSLLLPFFRRIVKLEILAWARLGPVLDFCESRIGPPIPSTIELIVREVPIGGLKPWLCPILGEIHPVRVENVMVGAVLDRSRFLFPSRSRPLFDGRCLIKRPALTCVPVSSPLALSISVFDAALAALMLAEYPRGRCVFAQTGGLPEERNAKAVWSSYDQVSDMQDTKLAWVQLDRPFFDCLAEWTAEHLPDDPWTANWHALVASADPFLDPAHPQPHQWSSVQEMVTWREDFLRQFQRKHPSHVVLVSRSDAS